MKTKNKLLGCTIVLFLLLPLLFQGCSSSDEGHRPLPPTIHARPLNFDFGIVTPGNAAEPLEVIISNNGTDRLNIGDIYLTDTDNFVLDTSGGSDPCASFAPRLHSGEECTVEVSFNPGDMGGSIATFDADLKIESNDPRNPELSVELRGIREDEITELNVRINQIEACGRPGEITAYVSVTDQGGYPVVGLAKEDFFITEIYEDGPSQSPETNAVSPVSDSDTVSAIALVMDYSKSITDLPHSLNDMEEAVISFIDKMGGNDWAEIIRFAEDLEVTPFMQDKNALKNAVKEPFDEDEYGIHTSFFDAVVKAVEDIQVKVQELQNNGNNVRKAVVVITDGDDNRSNEDLDGAIVYARENDVPVFTVGLGDDFLRPEDLEKISDWTGGQYYEAILANNLKTVYQQLADLLYEKQYIVTYDSLLPSDETAGLKIEVELKQSEWDDITGDHTKIIWPCD